MADHGVDLDRLRRGGFALTRASVLAGFVVTQLRSDGRTVGVHHLWVDGTRETVEDTEPWPVSAALLSGRYDRPDRGARLQVELLQPDAAQRLWDALGLTSADF